MRIEKKACLADLPQGPPPVLLGGGRVGLGAVYDPSSMLNADTRVVTGLRRGKVKPAGGEAAGAGAGPAAAAAAANAGVPAAGAVARRKYSGNSQDRICELLLPWRMLNECAESQQHRRDDGSSAASAAAPLNYESYDHYLETWEPLLMEEIKASILNSLPNSTKPKHARTGVVNVFNASEESALSTVTLGWHQVGNVDARDSHGGAQFSAFDMVILTISPLGLPLTARSAQQFVDQPLDGEIYLLAMVTDTARGSKGAGQTVTIKADRDSWNNCLETISRRCPSNGQDAPPIVRINTTKGLKTAYRFSYVIIDSLVSYWREFMALHDLRLNRPPLLSHILAHAQPLEMPPTPEHRPPDFFRHDSTTEDSPGFQLSPHLTGTTPSQSAPANAKATWSSPPPGLTPVVMGKFRAMFNDSQLLSIKTAAEQEGSGLTLIQGPPGTGKTTTAIGILNAMHLTTYHRYYEQLLAAVLGSEGVACRNTRASMHPDGTQLLPGHDPTPWVQLVSRVGKSKPHLLVAAPSNVAVDNIVQRIIQRGFLDGNGNKYNPSIVRVGGGKADAVQEVSLERIVDADELSFRLSGGTSDMDRRRALQRIVQDMRACVQDVYRLQSLLLNLRVAFGQHGKGSLPTGWELRVDAESAMPYWVDHLNCRTSMTPPEPPPPEPDAPPSDDAAATGGRGAKAAEDAFVFEPVDSVRTPVGVNDAAAAARAARKPVVAPTPATTTYKSHTELPEFQHYSKLICQSLEQLDKLKLQHSRCQARVDPTLFGGHQEARQTIESTCIDAAHVVFSTLNSSASQVMEMSEFQVTLVDEAAQCSEPSLLIALRKKCRHCIMVGDPQQLPATIFSDSARHKGYGRSLFERLMQTGQSSILLNVQYRMGPQISHFPNRMFYEGRVQDGDNVRAPGFYPQFVCGSNEAAAAAAAAAGRVPCFDPFMFLDLATSSDSGAGSGVGAGAEEDEVEVGFGAAVVQQRQQQQQLQPASASRSNPQEARLCLSLLKTLLLASLASGGPGSIGVITPYNEQLSELRRLFGANGLVHGALIGQALGDAHTGLGQAQARSLAVNSARFKQALQSATLDIELNTVDGFQGKEKDLIIISCVRANDFGSIGFLSDTRRMNVALSRAKYGMFVVGNASTLQHNTHWGQLLAHADASNALVRVQHADVNLLQLLLDRREALLAGGGGGGGGDSGDGHGDGDGDDGAARKRMKVAGPEEGEELE